MQFSRRYVSVNKDRAIVTNSSSLTTYEVKFFYEEKRKFICG